MLAARATKGLLTGVSGVTGQCDHLTLLEVIEVHRQIVAGTNFRLKLRLRTKLAPDCRREQVGLEILKLPGIDINLIDI